MITIEKVNFIRNSIPFYHQLNIDHQELIIQTLKRRFFHKGDYLLNLENECGGILVIEKGRIRAYIMSDDGREITLFRLLEKNICLLSSSCVFRNLNFSVYFEAEKDSTIFSIPSDVFEKISAANFYVKEYMLEQMAKRFSSAMWVMEQVVFGSLSKRVATYIYEQTQLENSLVLPITHDNIAKNIGSAREVVSRMLKHMENDEIIQLSRGTITINNLEKLKSLTK